MLWNFGSLSNLKRIWKCLMQLSKNLAYMIDHVLIWMKSKQEERKPQNIFTKIRLIANSDTSRRVVQRRVLSSEKFAFLFQIFLVWNYAKLAFSSQSATFWAGSGTDTEQVCLADLTRVGLGFKTLHNSRWEFLTNDQAHKDVLKSQNQP